MSASRDKNVVRLAPRNSDKRARAKALTDEEMSYGRVLSGTREQLIGAGIIAEGQFPGDPGQRKHSVHFCDQAGHHVNVFRESKHRYQARVHRTEAEQAAYMAAAESRAIAEDRRKHEEDRARIWREALARPNGVRAICQRQFEVGSGFLVAAFNMDLRQGLPFRFDARVRDRAAALLVELAQLLNDSPLRTVSDCTEARPGRGRPSLKLVVSKWPPQ